MTEIQKPPQVPPPGTIIVNARGQLTVQGHEFFVSLIRYLEILRREIVSQ